MRKNTYQAQGQANPPEKLCGNKGERMLSLGSEEEDGEMWAGAHVSLAPLENWTPKIQSTGCYLACRSSPLSSIRENRASPPTSESKMVTQLLALQSLEEDISVPEREQTRSRRTQNISYGHFRTSNLFHNSLRFYYSSIPFIHRAFRNL